LTTQIVDHLGGVDAMLLLGRDRPSIYGAVLSFLHGSLIFEPIVFEIEILILGDFIECEENCGFLNVRVVSRSPLHGWKRRIGAIPLAAGGGCG
jgi:hypothetical protein